LWIVSANKATEPVATITSTCSRAVMNSTPKEILSALIPLLLASSAVSTLSAASWLWGRKIS
jgi:hypothetical protein